MIHETTHNIRDVFGFTKFMVKFFVVLMLADSKSLVQYIAPFSLLFGHVLNVKFPIIMLNY